MTWADNREQDRRPAGPARSALRAREFTPASRHPAPPDSFWAPASSRRAGSHAAGPASTAIDVLPLRPPAGAPGPLPRRQATEHTDPAAPPEQVAQAERAEQAEQPEQAGHDHQAGPLADAGELLTLAQAALAEGRYAAYALSSEGGLTVGSAARTAIATLERAATLARHLREQAPHITESQRLEADALYEVAAVYLCSGQVSDADRATTALDAAEAAYSLLGEPDVAAVADTRARRACAHAVAGRALSALVDSQAAVLHHVLALDPAGPQQARLGLAGALTSAAVVQADHGSTHLALTAAQQAIALLLSLDGIAPSRTDLTALQVRAELVRALGIEIRMLRDLGRMPDLAVPIEMLTGLAGITYVSALLDGGSPGVRAGLPSASQHGLLDPASREGSLRLFTRPLDTVSIPGLLVEPAHLLEAARQGAATAATLAPHDPALALAAGRDAACLYACAEDLGLVEHPWPAVRVELARWLWLLSELGWLAYSTGDLALARDFATHAEHPLVRAENGRHLPETIARSLNESATRLRQLRRAVA